MEYKNFSIIITTYNRKDFLKKAIDSILLRSNLKYIKEIIITDDSEGDETKNYVLELKEKQKRIKYYRNLEYKKGASGGRNTGLDKATGDLILFLDDDDECIRDFTLEVLEFFNKNIDFDILLTDFIRSDNGRKAGYGIDHKAEIPYQNWLCSIKGDFLIIFKNSILDNHRFNDELIGMERSFYLELIKRSHARIYYLNRAFALKNIGHESILSTIEKNADRWVSAYRAYLEHYSNDYEKYCPKSASKYYNRKAYLEIILGDRENALTDLVKSLNFNKLNLETYCLFASIFFPKRIVISLKNIYLKIQNRAYMAVGR